MTNATNSRTSRRDSAAPERAHDKFVARARSLRRRVRRRWIATGAVALVAAVVGWVLLFSSVTRIQQVEIHGADEPAASQLRERATAILGQNVVRADLAGLQRNLAGVQAVDSVSVSRSLPHTLRIDVVERKAVYVAVGDGKQFLVDQTGLPFEQVTRAPSGLTRVTIDKPTSPQARGGLTAVASVIGSLSSSERAKVSGLAVSGGRVTFRFGSVQVDWGDATQGAQKAAALRAMGGPLAADPTAKLNLSSPGRPVIS